MNQELHQRAGEIFVQVRRLAGAERARVLDELCDGDAGLRAEVESLMANDAPSTPLDVPVAAAALIAGAVGGAPERIGRFKVLGLLGEGGMGVVYRAEQESPRRVVALKIMRSLSRSTATLRRFEREAEALARLRHAGIAQVYEVGTADTPWGACPYLAMELVEGRAITSYAAEAKLSVRDRLGLVALVADALHHAHTKGVIHRDLKPANILVEESSAESGTRGAADAGTARTSSTHSGTGTSGVSGAAGFASGGLPKILDFGVARLADQGPEVTSVTDPGQLIGTIRYMSPEQIGGDARNADVRSDLYSLALVGYELLTGRLPYDLDDKPFAEVTTLIREAEPAPLSRHDRGLAGDPDVIFAKALEKQPGRRYASAAEFAADIRRYLTDQPISARPASAVYQLRKFARRHRALVGGAVAGVMALVVVAGASAYAAVTTSRAKERVELSLQAEKTSHAAALREADKATRALLFIRQMLASARPDREGIDVRVVEVLDSAAKDADTVFAGQPDAEAVVRHTIGLAYQGLGRLPDSEKHLRRACELRIATVGADHLDTLDARMDLAETLKNARKHEEAAATINDVLAKLKSLGADQRERVYTATNILAQVYLLNKKGADAEREARSAIAIAEELKLPDARRGSAVANLALALTDQGKPKEAEPYYGEAARLTESALGAEHPLTLSAKGNAALAKRRAGRNEEARAELEKLLEVSRRVRGTEHAETLTLESNLGESYVEVKRYDEALKLYEHCRGVSAATLGEDNPRTLLFSNNMASAYFFMERYTEAEEMYRKVLASQVNVLGPTHQTTFTTRNNLARALHKQQRLEEAERVFRELVADGEKTIPTHWLPSAYRLGFGQCLTDAKKYQEAEENLLKSLGVLEARLGKTHAYVVKNREALVALYTAWGKSEEAGKYGGK